MHAATENIIELFGSLEIHTRKIVQMHSLARHFILKLANEIPAGFASFLYNKVYYAQLDDQFITIEQYLSGNFQKYVSNTGEIIPHAGEDLALKAEMFSHYTYVKSQCIMGTWNSGNHKAYHVRPMTLYSSCPK